MSKFTFEGDLSGTRTLEMEELASAKLSAQKAALQELISPSEGDPDQEAIDAEVARYTEMDATITDAAGALSALDAAIAAAEGAEEANKPVLADAASLLFPQGQAEVSFKNCRVKKFLHAVQAKGMKVCGDVQMVDGEIYLADGTAASSFIKEVELVHGTLSNGVFTPSDFSTRGVGDTGGFDLENMFDGPSTSPDGTQLAASDSAYGSQNIEDAQDPAAPSPASDGWYLRLVRPNGAIEYKEMQGLNQLLDGISATGEVLSILGAMNEIEDLQDAIRIAMAAEGLARVTDVDALETKVDADIAMLAAFVQHVEDDLVLLINNGDDEVVKYINARLDEVEEQFNEIHDNARLHGEAPVSVLASCGHSALFHSGDLSTHNSLSKWMIDVGVETGTGAATKRRNDIETAWTAQFKPTTSMNFGHGPAAYDPDGKEFKVNDADVIKIEVVEVELENNAVRYDILVDIDGDLTQLSGEPVLKWRAAGSEDEYADLVTTGVIVDPTLRQRLEIDASLESCPDDMTELDGLMMVVNAIYCGDQTDIAISSPAFTQQADPANELLLNTGLQADSDMAGLPDGTLDEDGEPSGQVYDGTKTQKGQTW